MEEEKTPVIEDSTRALIGAANGMILYDFFWSSLVIIALQLIMGNSYVSLIENHYHTVSLAIMIVSSILTLVAALFIAKPKVLLKAYDKINLENLKLIFKTLGVMLLFTIGYNLFVTILGVDIAGGNQNQNNVVDLIYSNAPLAFISMIIIAPLLEEVTYRYFLFGGIAKFNRKWAIIISGFIFMCAHAVASFTGQADNILRELILLPPYMFSGMALAYAYDKTSNLTVSTSIHALNNLISFILCFI